MARTSVNRIRILDEGIEVSSGADSMDFTGAGVLVSAIGGSISVTINGGGAGALTILSATGVIDDSNVQFTFTSKPKIIVINSLSYTDGSTTGGSSLAGGVAWTWDNPTLTATIFGPVGLGNSIYGIT